MQGGKSEIKKRVVVTILKWESNRRLCLSGRGIEEIACDWQLGNVIFRKRCMAKSNVGERLRVKQKF